MSSNIAPKLAGSWKLVSFHSKMHHIEAALLPNWVGTDRPRHFEFAGKYLTLQGPLRLGGVQGVVSLVWERLP